MISQFFIINKRGDILVFLDFRFDIDKTTIEIFFRHLKEDNFECEPIF